MRHYCTLFDINYAAKGLALYDSLLIHSSEEFVLHILAMDNDTFWLVTELNLSNVQIIPLASFERQLKLEPVRKSRSWQEYCWTCASSLMEYLLPLHDHIVYLDSDLFFFSDPKPIFEEVGSRYGGPHRSIGITEHRFNEKDRKRLEKNGRFNVGVVYAESTTIGMMAISKWADQCREWCFKRNENGKFADQAYLDSWPREYPNQQCWSYDNIGINAGPWNIGNFKVWKRDGKTYLTETPRGAPHLATYWELVCYHFHEFRNPGHLTGWPLRPEDIEFIYEPYVAAFTEAKKRIEATVAHIEKRHQDMKQQMETA